MTSTEQPIIKLPPLNEFLLQLYKNLNETKRMLQRAKDDLKDAEQVLSETGWPVCENMDALGNMLKPILLEPS